MNNKQVLESCMVFSVSDIKRGMYWIRRGLKQGAGTWDGLIYVINQKNDKLWLEIDYISQKILIKEKDIRFGTRAYLTCYKCGNTVDKLYMPENSRKFVCRHCACCPYESTRINKHSKHGKILFTTSKMIKLSNMRSKISHLFHKGRFTARFKRYLNWCEKYGFTNEVAEANKLLKAVSG